MKHKPVELEYDDSSGKYIGCEVCGLWMGFAEGYWAKDSPGCTDGECPGKPVEDVIVEGWREFWISPDFGGGVDSSIRRLYGGSQWLSKMEKVTREEFESDYGPMLGMRVGKDGSLEAVTEKYIVFVDEYDGSEGLVAVERSPRWFEEGKGEDQ